jgi:hypothetical protein
MWNLVVEIKIWGCGRVRIKKTGGWVGQHILTNLRQSFVFISFKVRDKGLSEEKQRNFFQTILYLLPLLSCTLLKIKYLQEFLMKK